MYVFYFTLSYQLTPPPDYQFSLFPPLLTIVWNDNRIAEIIALSDYQMFVKFLDYALAFIEDVATMFELCKKLAFFENHYSGQPEKKSLLEKI